MHMKISDFTDQLTDQPTVWSDKQGKLPPVLLPVFLQSMTGIHNLIQSDQHSQQSSKMFKNSL